MQRAGMRIAADDVGAGNAGLRLLSQFRFDIVKIDLSLVQGGAEHDTSRAVLRSLRDLAGRWGASVIAEGVETAEPAAHRPRAGHHCRPGLSARTADRTTVDRPGRSRCVGPSRARAVHPTIRDDARLIEPVGASPHGRRAQDHRVNVDGHPNPARLPPLHGHRLAHYVETDLGLFRSAGSPQSPSWSPRTGAARICP